MSMRSNRRDFLHTAAIGGALAGLGDLGFLSRLRPVSAAEARLSPDVVRLDPEIEPLVRLIEDTPRERLLEEVAAGIHRGLTYREVLAALLLAGVRNVQPRPSVGFKFHAVLVVNSAHLASLSSPDEDRWLPIFWALDYFKISQARDVREGDWTMAPVDESAVPPAHQARDAFIAAMQGWDVAAADPAAAAMARTAGTADVFELFYRFGARDFRSIGHKAIYVANAKRTLEAIGWHHAEPVLRSLAYALLNAEGDSNPATSDLDADRPGRRNLELAGSMRAEWQDGENTPAAAADMLGTLRSADAEDATRHAVELLNGGTSPQAIWDATFARSGEMLMQAPGIVPLHAVTTSNAVFHAFQASGDDTTRRWLLLQNVAFTTLFRDAARRRGSSPADRLIDAIEPVAVESSGPAALEEIFATVSDDRGAAASKALAFLSAGGTANDLLTAARRLVFLKGNEVHDYKYSSAVLEDYHHVSPALRDRFLAAAMYYLPGSGERDNQLVERTRSALEA